MISTLVCGDESARETVTSGKIVPLLRAVELDVGEIAVVALADGNQVQVKLVSLNEQTDSISAAVRRATVVVEVDGLRTELVAGNYQLPIQVGQVQIDCSVTSGYNRNGTPATWGLQKDARLRLWLAESPWIRPESFDYPVRQRWFATLTQMANEPTYVDGGEKPSRQQIYYHSGLDIGGMEGRVEVIAATDGLVVSAGTEVSPEHKQLPPVRVRYDVVNVLDARGWYYRYSHLKQIDSQIKSRQPSGQWGTQAGYAFLWQAYLRQYRPNVIAVARPHHFAKVGETVELDASKSWSRAGGDTMTYRWLLQDGTEQVGPTLSRQYATAGTYSEVVKVADQSNNVAYDFAVVQVIDPRRPQQIPPTIHPTYWPTNHLRVGDEIQFGVRSFRATGGNEVWDFGDGSPPVAVQSDGNQNPRDPNGYAITTHRFRKPGDYLVHVRRTNEFDLSATGHLHVRIE